MNDQCSKLLITVWKYTLCRRYHLRPCPTFQVGFGDLEQMEENQAIAEGYNSVRMLVSYGRGVWVRKTGSNWGEGEY